MILGSIWEPSTSVCMECNIPVEYATIQKYCPQGVKILLISKSFVCEKQIVEKLLAEDKY